MFIFKKLLKPIIYSSSFYYLNSKINLCNFDSREIYELYKNNIFTLVYKKEIITNAILYKDNYLIGFIPTNKIKNYKKNKNKIILKSFFDNLISEIDDFEFFDEENGFFIIKFKKNEENFEYLNFEKNNIGDEIIAIGLNNDENYLRKFLITDYYRNDDKYPFIHDKILETENKINSFYPIFSNSNNSFRGIINLKKGIIINNEYILNILNRFENENEIIKPKLGLNISEHKLGLSILKIYLNSIFENEEIAIGDVITKVNNIKVKNIKEFKNLIGYSYNIPVKFTFINNNLEEKEIELIIK